MRSFILFLNALFWVANPSYGAEPTLSVGREHTCVQSKGRLHCFGALMFEHKKAPLLEMHVSHGGSFCSLDVHGDVRCLGRSTMGLPKGRHFQKIAIGERFFCGVDVNGALLCTSKDTFAPLIMQKVRKMKPQVSEIAAGGENFCFLDAKGRLSCLSGPLQRVLSERLPSQPIPLLTGLSVGAVLGCAKVKSDQRVFCFGEGAENLKLPFGPVLKVSVGLRHVCVVRKGGALQCFGKGGNKLLKVPVGDFIEVAAGARHNCAMDKKHKIHCWGANGRDQSSPPRWL